MRALIPMTLLLALGSAWTLPAMAQMSPLQNDGGVFSSLKPRADSDTVSFDLAVEDWVTTATARVSVTVDAAVTALKNGAGAHEELLAAVTALVPDAPWRLTRFDRSVDAAGLEHWQAVAEARVAETGLSGLADKARAASRPGLQLHIDQIAFDPTLAEIEAVRARLRAGIYRAVGTELAGVNTAFPGRDFRVGTIAVTETRDGPQPPMPAMAMRSLVASPAPEPALTVSEKLRLFAHVTLAAKGPQAN